MVTVSRSLTRVSGRQSKITGVTGYQLGGRRLPDGGVWNSSVGNLYWALSSSIFSDWLAGGSSFVSSYHCFMLCYFCSSLLFDCCKLEFSCRVSPKKTYIFSSDNQ
jgi:hypothetical protein